MARKKKKMTVSLKRKPKKTMNITLKKRRKNSKRK